MYGGLIRDEEIEKFLKDCGINEQDIIRYSHDPDKIIKMIEDNIYQFPDPYKQRDYFKKLDGMKLFIHDYLIQKSDENIF